MRKGINLWSFVLSLFCLVLYLTVVTWKGFAYFVIETTGTDALNIVFFLSWITLFLGIVGMIGKRDGKLLLRGIVTVLITFGLSGMLTMIMLLNQSLF
ncbi:hypothetical protein LG329_08030 [Virgibacillus necropolis]|uniref:hypothetical protein n=1 Tax=Virgibacillus necropolis TaxID=163877 RepID=UPI00384ABADB